MKVTHQTSKYIASIRNRDKREYALNYLQWLADDRRGSEPERKCSYLAAQAVRLELTELTGC